MINLILGVVSFYAVNYGCKKYLGFSLIDKIKDSFKK